MSTADHAHCPLDCEHPQPFQALDDSEKRMRWWCGRCAAKFGLLTEMVPCAPPYCAEADDAKRSRDER